MLNACGLFPHQSALQTSRHQQHVLQLSSVLTLSTQTPQGETLRLTRLSPMQMPATSSGSPLCLPSIQLNYKSGVHEPLLGLHSLVLHLTGLREIHCWHFLVSYEGDDKGHGWTGTGRDAQTKWSLGKGLGAPVPSPGPPPSLGLRVLFNTEAPWTPVSRDFHDLLVLKPWLIIISVPSFLPFADGEEVGLVDLKKRHNVRVAS